MFCVRNNEVFSICINSLNVSNINSLATVTWEDFLSQLPRFRNFVDKKQLHFIKYIGVMYACIILGFAFCVGFLSGVIETAMLTSSATTGPLVGVFLLAVFVPIANWKVKCKFKINVLAFMLIPGI